MFEHFTFGAQAQTRYLEPEDVMASPTDCSYPLTPQAPTSYFPSMDPTAPMSDIMNAFSQQTLHPDETPNRSIWNDSIASPNFSIDDEFTPEEMNDVPNTTSSTSSLPNLPHPRTSTLSTVACKRLQRQLNTQLQSCNTHRKDISSLVEDMLTTNPQCRLHKVSSRPHLASPPSGLVPSSKAELEAELAIEVQAQPSADFADRAISPDEDEGFAEMDDPYGLLAFEEEVTLRMASAPSGIRKYNVVRWRKSAECMGTSGASVPVARMKVRSMPRMRRRKPETVVE
ncbi:hypothetical protein VTL71DRAFT_12426 [Oculimacula yallundae]|uniref:Uncharacterized protein n=1 Tax=Oculimacula yallundae TaxID=86028 RepID=A0ABR4CPP7_9HELO